MKQAKYAIGCYSDRGPTFTGGHSYELCARVEPFNGDNKCMSWAKQSGYEIPLQDWKNMLTNRVDGKFTIIELEVWEVEYI